MSRPESFIFARRCPILGLSARWEMEKTSEKFFQGQAFRNNPDDDPAAPETAHIWNVKLSMAELFIG